MIKFTLRPYQNEARYQVNTLLNAGRNPLFVSCTGSGKTKTSVVIIEDQIKMNQTVYITTPQIEIFDQWIKDLVNAGLNPGTIDDKGIQPRRGIRKVYVCMIISLNNCLPFIPESIYPDILIDDEAHLAAANIYRTVHKFFSTARRYGMTGSPYRYDNKSLGNIYTDMVETTSMQECMNKNFLAKSLILVPEKHYLNMDIPKYGVEFNMAEQVAKLGKTEIIGDFIADYGHIFQGHPAMVACCTIEHAGLICKMFNKAGWNFKQLKSDLPRHERRKIINQIKKGTINGVTTVGVGVLGLDIPGLYGVMWMAKTMSLTKWLQFNGRGLRALEGKEFGIIYDAVGNTFLHGAPEMHRDWSLDGDYAPVIPDPNAPIMRICPFCGVANASDNNNCHFCGKDLNSEEAKQKRKRHLPAMVDGELIAVESDGHAEEISRRSERIKTEQFEEAEKEKVREEAEAIEVTQNGKMAILRNGLFDETRPMFRGAVKDYL